MRFYLITSLLVLALGWAMPKQNKEFTCTLPAPTQAERDAFAQAVSASR